jgi:IPT/TIG domain-containing protein
MKNMFVLFALLFAVTISADPVITSISPAEGPVAGGTTVTIHGSGFNNTCIICSPPFADPIVFFGGTRSPSVHVIDASTMTAVTPAHLPRNVFVRVGLHDGSQSDSILENAFTFTGDPESAFEPVLFPIFQPPVDGAFGSRFETIARVGSTGALNGAPAIYGVDTQCSLADPTMFPFNPFAIVAERFLPTTCSHSVGRIFWIQSGTRLGASLRVRDTSRQASSHGVEVPVVKRSDFTNDSLVLLGVPADPRFRKRLRVYGLPMREVVVNVEINGNGAGYVLLQPSESLFEPSYAEFTNFATNLPPDSFMRVRLFMGRLPDGTIPPNTPPFWGLISVTNNDTQEITVISPQP